MTEEIKSRLNWLYAVEGTEKERAALLAICDLAMAFIDGVPSTTLEPHFRWMADVEIHNK